MRAHSSLRLGTLHGTTPELLASPCYCAWGFCMVWEAGLPHKTSSAPPQRRNGRACSSLTARGGGLPVGVRRQLGAVGSRAYRHVVASLGHAQRRAGTDDYRRLVLEGGRLGGLPEGVEGTTAPEEMTTAASRSA